MDLNARTAKALGLTFPPRTAWPRRRSDRVNARDVRYWPKADIGECTAHGG